MELCFDSLHGLSVGDAMGAQFFVPGTSFPDLVAGRAPDSPWPWTDDTEMACSVVTVLGVNGAIDQDDLAAAFAEHFEPYRGYGGGAVQILRQIRNGTGWREASRAAFGGQGSMGNGAAMRVAPIGAFHAESPTTAALDAVRSAEVTHVHPEAVLGAVGVAVAAASAGQARHNGVRPAPSAILDAVLDHLVDSRVKAGVEAAQRLLGATVAEAAYLLGNGSQVLAQDTVPFTLWVAATYLDDYRSAILACIGAGGDVDTTAAIVGGVVATYTGRDGIPLDWRTSREPLPDFVTSPFA
ncbi:ADP-ribosylglycohydrolase family protein [Cryptosporangium sp. NPDC051539]|uniref:ADP-ribosylglycohydrolase family protein n=1 Tax=Cryptosporangium sp. NPDC051539 TaxID=3363962 RepID=UPI0037BDF1D0